MLGAEQHDADARCPLVVCADPEGLRLNNRAFTVVGVAERGFDGASLVGTEVWVPIAVVALGARCRKVEPADGAR